VKNEAANRVRVEARIRKQARDLGFQLVAAPCPQDCER
jgi:hypothetical protein